jgi:L-lactate dehydrogenase complex protein LldG
VHAALDRSHTIKPPALPPLDESIARLAKAGDDLVKLFHARAAASGMFVHRPKAADVTRHIVEFLGTRQVKSVVLGPVPVAGGLEQAIRAAGITIVDWRAAQGVDVQFDVDCGITGVRAALAETGSMILCSDANHSRGLSLIPPLHVAVVRPSEILPDMIDYWASLRGIPSHDLPSNMVFITGPSKTADIEGELVTGVHGPEAVHVLLVDE